MKKSQKRSLVTATLGLGATTLVVASLVAGGGMCQGGEPGIAAAAPSPTQSPAPKAEKKKFEKFELEKCAPAKGTASADQVKADPKARKAAQKGLDFLAQVGPAWQETNNCYGCHVQAVTVEAFSVGHSNQYNIDKKAFDTMLSGMLELDGGARHHADGLSHGSPEIAKGAKILGAIAFGRYDEHVNTTLRKELLFEAEKILALQAPDGSVNTGWVNAPVSTGQLQYTALAMSTWRRAYERDADDKWLTGIQRAEDWLYGAANGLKDNSAADIQQLDYAVIGFLAAGVGTEETTLRDLRKAIEKRQNKDGGWGLQGGGESQTLSTGQVVYTLRLLGLTDRDKSVKQGTKWLITHQQTDGGWGRGGSEKAAAMWAVLGLVSVDVLTVSVDGIQDGTRVDGKAKIELRAADNKGRGVEKVELVLDDIPVYGACGDALSWTFDPTGLEDGKHIIDAIATNANGDQSVRRFEVFTGDVFITQVGTRFNGGQTEISARNLGGLQGGAVEVEIYEVSEKDGAPVAGKKLRTLTVDNKPGAARLLWDGKAEGGKEVASGKYRVRIVAKDKEGKPRQSEDIDFVHDTLENQKSEWAEVQGQLALPAGADAANAEVELVDDLGNVVGRTRSTGAGQYRFKGVAGGKKYKVRVNKRGFRAESKAFAPAKSAEEAVDLDLAAE